MSLNTAEERVYDYLKTHAEERLFWQQKVQTISRGPPAGHDAALELEGELWRYYVERSEHAPGFREAARREGLQRTSMLNLAELILHLWGAAPASPRK